MEMIPRKATPVVQTIFDEMKRLDWSVVELAEAADVPFQTVYRIFDGVSPNIETVNKLLKALKMKLVVAR